MAERAGSAVDGPTATGYTIQGGEVERGKGGERVRERTSATTVSNIPSVNSQTANVLNAKQNALHINPKFLKNKVTEYDPLRR